MIFNYNTGFPCLSDVLSLWLLAGVELGGGGASWAGLLQEEGRGAGPGPAAGRWSVHYSARRRCPLNWNGKQLPAVVILPGTGDLWRERPRRKPSTVSKKCELGCLGRRPSRRTQDWGVWAGGALCSEVAWEKRSCGHSEFTVESRARESAGPCPELTLGGFSGPRPRLHDSPQARLPRGGKWVRPSPRSWGAEDPGVLYFSAGERLTCRSGRPDGCTLERSVGSFCLSRELHNSLLGFPVACHQSLVNEKLSNFPHGSRREWVAWGAKSRGSHPCTPGNQTVPTAV